MTSSRVPGSFRDPSGFLYEKDGDLLRQVNAGFAPDFDALSASGLYEELIGDELLIEHELADPGLAMTADSYQVIRPERLPFISYPYEWSFGQLKDAALLTLDIQARAFEKGMVLKDASAYNVQFRDGRPIFIDTLSFARYQPGRPWVAYRQFCQHFLAPLTLMSEVDIGLNQLLRTYIDGVPLTMAASMLPLAARMKPSLMMHLWMHARSQRNAQGRHESPSATGGTFSETAFRGLVDSLRRGTEKLEWKPGGTEWHDYYEANNNYGEFGLAEKEKLVHSFLKTAAPDTVWDLGANTGRFSRIAAESGAFTVSFDIDPGCVESNYQHIKANGEKNLLPLLIDLANPSPAIGWNNAERMSLSERGPVDAVLALGLIHHLAITNNVPLGDIAEYLRSLCRWLVIEFVPRGDEQVDKLLQTRRDIYDDYSPDGFLSAFQRSFEVRKTASIPGMQRTVYLMQSRG